MAKASPQALIPIALIAALGLGGWYVEVQRSKDRSTLSGFFESQPTTIASRVGGRVRSILVKEGDTVRPGALLMQFEAGPSADEAAAKEALAEEARQKSAQAQRGPRKEEIQRQQAAVAEAEDNLARLRNGARPEEIGAAKARVAEARAQYHKAQSGARPQEIAGARAAEQAAKAKLAQAERGLTPEERAQARARYDAALAAEQLAAKEAARMEYLVREGAESQQNLDRAHTNLQTAQAHTREMREALQRAEAGTPKEELEQTREGYRQAKAALDLVLAGSRSEDIEAARQQMAAADQNLRLLQKGSRVEDIRAAEAKVAQAQAVLDELKAGSRAEEIAASRSAYKAAAAQARGSQATLAERELRSPISGIVERKLVAEGDLVQPGSPVLRLSDPDDIWLRVYVPESSLSRLHVGTDASLHVDGVQSDVDAVVESIASRGEFTPANLQTPDERGKQVFAVQLRLRKRNPSVKAGMFATVKRLGDLKW